MRSETKNPRWLPGRNHVRVLMLSLVLGAGTLFVGFAGGQGQSVLPEVQVTAASIPDYEFDSARDGRYCPTCNGGDGNSRLVFSDNSNNLWVGHVDFQTGAFLPADGHGALLASNSHGRDRLRQRPGVAVLERRLPDRLYPVPAPCDPPRGHRPPSAWPHRSAARGRPPPCPPAPAARLRRRRSTSPTPIRASTTSPATRPPGTSAKARRSG